MITRRQFIHASSVAVGSAGVSAAEAEPILFSVGLIADAQYVDADAKGIRHYRRSVQKLERAVKEINEEEVEFSIHLGDLIDRNFESFDTILEPLTDLHNPIFQILGNHDYDVAEEKKRSVPQRLGMDSPYYSFSKDGFRFIFLDGTEVSTFASGRDSENHKRALRLIAQCEAEGRSNAKSWNGGLGAEQMSWLEMELKAAVEAFEKVIISCHYPVFPENSHNLLNDREVLALLAPYANVIVAWFNGHNHAGNYAEKEGIHFVTLEGMVNTPDTNAFAILDVSPNQLTIRGKGRVPQRQLIL